MTCSASAEGEPEGDAEPEQQKGARERGPASELHAGLGCAGVGADLAQDRVGIGCRGGGSRGNYRSGGGRPGFGCDLGVEPGEVLLQQVALTAEFGEAVGHGGGSWRGAPRSQAGKKEGVPWDALKNDSERFAQTTFTLR